MRILFASSLSALLFLAAGCNPVADARQKAKLTQDLNSVRQVTIFIQEFAMDNDGKFPASLKDIEADGGMPAEILQVGDGDGNMVKLQYIPGHTVDDLPTTIILHGPARSDGKRVAGYLDGAAKILEEAEFQAQMQKEDE